MFKRLVGFVLIFTLLASLSGCATICKKKVNEVEDLKNQVARLEAQLQEKDQEINNLREALLSMQDKSARQIVAPEVKPMPTVAEIQTALKNAGFDPGPIDGKMGKKTKEAIKAFQKANGLQADGKVGSKTWELLSAYLSKKVK